MNIVYAHCGKRKARGENFMNVEKRFYQIKPVDELTFADDFMFGRVMRDKTICKELLERLLKIKIGKLSFPKLQEGHKNCIHAIFV